MKIGHCWLKSILPTRPPFYRRAVLIFQQENRGRKQAFHSPSPVKHWTIPPLRRDDKNRRRPAVLGTRGWSNWPERAGGHLQHGSGQICIRLCGLRWCRWWPDATASPRFCHCRVWVRVRQASRKNRRRSPNQRGTKEGRLAAKTCSRWNGSWLHRQTGKRSRTTASEQSAFKVKFVLLCWQSVPQSDFWNQNRWWNGGEGKVYFVAHNVWICEWMDQTVAQRVWQCRNQSYFRNYFLILIVQNGRLISSGTLLDLSQGT